MRGKTVLMSLLFLVLIAPFAFAALPKAVWFSYMDDTSITDEVSGYDGTASGCFTIDRAGQNAIYCDTSDYIRTPQNAYVNLTDNLAIAFYAKINTSQTNRIWTHYGYTLGLYAELPNNRYVYGGGNSYYDRNNVLLTNGNWYHFVVVFSSIPDGGALNADRVTTYVNGALDDLGNGGSSVITYNYDDDYILGAFNITDTSRTLTVDNLAYFDHALTATEVNSLYNNSGVPDLTGGLGVGTCAGNLSYPVINITIYDEDNSSTTHTTRVELQGNVTNGTSTINITRTLTGDDSYILCSYEKTGSAYFTGYAIYTQNDVTNRYYILNDTLTFGTENLYRYYMLNDTDATSTLKLTVRRVSNYNYYQDIIVKLQRYFAGENVYRTVQMDKSDDYGLATFNIREKSADYRLLFLTENEELLATSTNLKFACTSGLCELTYLINDLSAPASDVDFTAFTTYNASSGIILINWSDPLGDTHTVTNSFTRHTITGISVLCNSTQTGSDGQASCNVSGYNGAVLVTADTSTQNIINEWVQIDTTTLYDVLDSEDATVLTAVIFVTVLGLGAASTIASLIAGVIGLVIIYFLGVFNPITVGVIILGAIGAIAIGVGVNKNG